MAQLGMLRARRREGTAPGPRGGRTTPCCCPTGHKMFGEGRAQMEERAFVEAFTMGLLGCVKCNCKHEPDSAKPDPTKTREKQKSMPHTL
ncbi:hypothetical protein Q5P01_009239 [Channa striata]|uniref:Uncharacterized protein n=1 Tax=Channa striata TaxID=64152 RepID=A0AA88N3N4_CHASR|nr:hypothetical protein Q5P01_009239 [Channa striata]